MKKNEKALCEKAEEAYWVKKDYVTALREFEPLARQGIAPAQWMMGWMYAHGDIVPQNHKTAAKWYRLGANQGYAPSQSVLSDLYQEGKGVPQNHKTALKWLKLAANGGIPRSQKELGDVYREGKGVPQNYKTAVKWYTLAAKHRYANADARSILGDMYANGEGIPQDYKTAAKWHRRAANIGNVESQFKLGVMYTEGKGVPRNHRTAAKWYTLAAEQRNTDAQVILGRMYEEGKGVTQNNVSAHMWWNIAESRGFETYKEAAKNRDRIDRVAEKMTPPQIEEAQNLARARIPVDYKITGWIGLLGLKKRYGIFEGDGTENDPFVIGRREGEILIDIVGTIRGFSETMFEILDKEATFIGNELTINEDGRVFDVLKFELTPLLHDQTIDVVREDVWFDISLHWEKSDT